MNNQLTVDRSVLRWAGLAGIAGGIVFALTFVVVIAFALPDPGDPQALARFPDIRAARTLENGLYLVAVILWVPLFIALDRVLRQTSLAPALGGSAVGILGLAVLAAGALPHVASARLSDLYHAAGATPEDKATLVLVWQANEGIFESLLTAGIVLGFAGLAAACLALVDPGSPIVAAGFLAVMVFQLLVGWKAYRLSRTS